MEKFNNKIYNGLNSFDKIMYINLKNRPERKEQIINEFKKMKIDNNKIIRIDAILNNYNGHLGCCKSHIKALELAKKMNLNNVLIFEDDFVFNQNKKETYDKINYFLNKFNNYDVLQFSYAHKSLIDINDNIIKKVENASTASGYVIKKHFIDKLLDLLKLSQYNLEKEELELFKKNNKKTVIKITQYAFDQLWYELQQKSKWYIFDPPLGKQGGNALESSIGDTSFLEHI